MKKTVLMFVFLASCMLCNAQNSLFSKYGDVKGVSTVYISKAMLGMVSGIKAAKGDISKIATKLDYLQILNCDRPSMIPSIKSVAIETFKKESFEQIMQINNNGESVYIYHKAHKNKKNEFTLLCIDKESLQVINITGNVTLNDIKSLSM